MIPAWSRADINWQNDGGSRLWHKYLRWYRLSMESLSLRSPDAIIVGYVGACCGLQFWDVWRNNCPTLWHDWYWSLISGIRKIKPNSTEQIIDTHLLGWGVESIPWFPHGGHLLPQPPSASRRTSCARGDIPDKMILRLVHQWIYFLYVSHSMAFFPQR